MTIDWIEANSNMKLIVSSVNYFAKQFSVFHFVQETHPSFVPFGIPFFWSHAGRFDIKLIPNNERK